MTLLKLYSSLLSRCIFSFLSVTPSHHCVNTNNFPFQKYFHWKENQQELLHSLTLLLKLAYCIPFILSGLTSMLLFYCCCYITFNTFLQGPNLRQQTQYPCALIITFFPIDNSWLKPLFKNSWCWPSSRETPSTCLFITPWPLPFHHSFLQFQKFSLLFIVSFKL